MALIDPTFHSSRLSDIVRRNSTINSIQGNVFLVAALHAVAQPPSAALLAGAASLLLLMAAPGRRRARG